jgi:hypothetical protein
LEIGIGDEVGEFGKREGALGEGAEDEVLGGGVGFCCLVPECAEVGVAVAVEVGVGDDRFDICQCESRFDFAAFFKADAVETGD